MKIRVSDHHLVPIIIIVCFLSLSRPVRPAENQLKPSTYTYKKVGALEIKADVYRTADKALRPVVVQIHGGALISGGRVSELQRFRQVMLDAGYAVVSIDYRLAPETKLPEIIKDVEDALSWIRGAGPGLFNVDTSRIAVMGGSAGGYLTLTAGFRANPRPAVLISLWGYGDLIGEWYSKPSPHARHHEIVMQEDEAYRQVSGPPISNADDRKGNGGAFYQFCRQRGLWPKAVSGWDPFSEADKFVPYMPVRNVSRDFPPTLLIHGTADTDVPFEQSQMMAEQLRKHGVAHQFIPVQGAEHGLKGADTKLIQSLHRTALEFVDRYMRGPRQGGGK